MYRDSKDTVFDAERGSFLATKLSFMLTYGIYFAGFSIFAHADLVISIT